MVKRNNPNVTPIAIVDMQVAKLGSWEGRGPYGLFVSVFQGGAIQIAQGTKHRMCELQRDAKRKLSKDWGPAQCVAGLIRGCVPPIDRPPR